MNAAKTPDRDTPPSVSAYAEVAELLRESSALFTALDDATLDELLGLASPRQVKARQTVCHKGEQGDELFILVHGKLKVCSSSDDGREAILAILEDGDVSGEMSIIDGHPRSADVVAVQDSEILVIHRRQFLPFLEAHPKAAIALLTALIKRLRWTDTLVEDMHFLDIRTRLAKTLVRLSQDHGRTTAGGGIRIDLKLSQEDLGNLVGATRESVNKQMRVWVEEGILELSQTNIVVRKAPELQAYTRPRAAQET
jgi:CRP/FNR family transcriptional regulator, cyclic AMP receptor protein